MRYVRVAVFVVFVSKKKKKTWPSKIVSPIIALQPGEKKAISIPKSSSVLSDLVIGWSDQREILRQGKSFHQRHVGTGFTGNRMEFYLRHPTFSRKAGAIAMHNALEVSVSKQVDQLVKKPSETALKQSSNTNLADIVEVRLLGKNETTPEEAEHIRARRQFVRKGFKQLLGHESDCTIALLSSGGGYRAMVSLAGALDGLQRGGILPCVTYISGISGSCWGLSQFIRQVQLNPEKPMDEIIETMRLELRDRISKPPIPSMTESAKLIMENTAAKLNDSQSLSLVGPFGALLANALPTSPTLSSQVSVLKDGKCPFPIYGAAALDMVDSKVVLAEFSPVSVIYKDAAIPSSALGRRFDNGRSIDDVPELPMSDLLGVFGSAFCTTVEKVVENIFWLGGQGATALKLLVAESALAIVGHHVDKAWQAAKTTMEKLAILNRNVALAVPMVYPLHVPSWLFNSEAHHYTPSTIAMMDGGVDCNLAWAISQRRNRNISVIIALDHSEDINGDSGYLTLQGLMKLREEEMAGKGASNSRLRLPEVNWKGMDEKRIAVFGDHQKGEIVIIYIPTKPFMETDFDPWKETGPMGFCNVLNFVYTNENFDKLYNLSKNNMNHHRQAIVDVISKVAGVKKN